jgi:hypothetical protein
MAGWLNGSQADKADAESEPHQSLSESGRTKAAIFFSAFPDGTHIVLTLL